MGIKNYYNFTYKIKVNEELTNITNKINNIIKKLKIKEGLILIYTKHTTTAVKLLEDEFLLRQDTHEFLEKIATSKKKYKHDMIELRTVPPDEPKNGCSHLRALLISNRELIPIVNGKLELGKWQQIMYIELDPKHRGRTFSVFVLEFKK